MKAILQATAAVALAMAPMTAMAQSHMGHFAGGGHAAGAGAGGHFAGGGRMGAGRGTFAGRGAFAGRSARGEGGWRHHHGDDDCCIFVGFGFDPWPWYWGGPGWWGWYGPEWGDDYYAPYGPPPPAAATAPPPPATCGAWTWLPDQNRYQWRTQPCAAPASGQPAPASAPPQTS
jgi:hypothetical protein